MSRIVLDLNDRRPIWTVPSWAVQEIEAALPEGWELYVAAGEADGSGDGSGEASPEIVEAVKGATVYVGLGIPADVLEAGGGSLRWVHTGAAGVGGSLTPELRESGVHFTNSAGIHGPPMAETVTGMILHFARGLDLALQGQREGRWRHEPFLAADTPVREVAGSTVGILGLGGIGTEVAERLAALGAKVLGWKRNPAPAPPYVSELLTGEEGRERILTASDVVVVTVPETRETRGLLDGAALRRMKEGALLVNVSRGGLVDTSALVELLRSGHLRGAALDVTDPEPLPDGHPLWELPNVLITPHVSAVSRGFWRRQTDLIVENLQRFVAGSPLRNAVDLEAGY